MSVFAKPSNLSFEIAPNKLVDFMKKSSNTSFSDAMKRFEAHGGNISKKK